MKCLVLVLLAGVVLSAPSENQRVKRQILPNCVDTFSNVPNPCTSNPTKRVYFPHPRDATKFIQCDVFGRMFVIQCPASENYNQATTSCIQKQSTLTTPTPNTGLAQNPCTAASIAKGSIYFAVADKTQFIECDLNGNANVLTCPAHLVWDQRRLSCVYNFLLGQPVTTPNPNNLQGLATNPCKGSQPHQFYSHPDATKFIQCDIAGDAYVLSCPSGLVWNQFSLTCVSPYTIATNG